MWNYDTFDGDCREGRWTPQGHGPDADEPQEDE